MIISASRRTDIPAFYSEWFFNRIKEGYCLVPNPFNKNKISKILLAHENVDAFIFWTKNPRPMIDKLEILDRMNYNYIFLYTVNEYPKCLEPNIPELKERIIDFKKISEHLGPKRIIWRYDPIILSSSLNYEYHVEIFEKLCCELAEYTKRVIISFIDMYKHVVQRLESLSEGKEILLDPSKNIPYVKKIGRELANLASKNNLEMFSCAELIDLTGTGIIPGACIDGMYLYSIFEREFSYKKDPGQRGECKCVISRDIGDYDTCKNLCPYCYANRSVKVFKKNIEKHDPKAPSLIGWLDDIKTQTSLDF